MYRIKKAEIASKLPSPSDRIAALARLGQTIVHARDLASLWQIRDRNTLYTTLKRYAQKGLLFRIHKGLYALKPFEELDPLLLGLKALHRFAYVSTETVLADYGIIQQKLTAITLIAEVSRKFSVGVHRYVCRKLDDQYLYNPAGIMMQGSIQVATPERAVADLLYFNPQAYFDGATHIDWKKVRALQYKIGYPLTSNRYDVAQSK